MNLEKIEEYGELMLSYQEIAILEGIDADELADPMSEAYKAYHRGRLRTEIMLRREIIDAASNGSPDGQEKLLKIILDTKSKNLRYE